LGRPNAPVPAKPTFPAPAGAPKPGAPGAARPAPKPGGKKDDDDYIDAELVDDEEGGDPKYVDVDKA
jgi:hypothetical protein